MQAQQLQKELDKMEEEKKAKEQEVKDRMQVCSLPSLPSRCPPSHLLPSKCCLTPHPCRTSRTSAR